MKCSVIHIVFWVVLLCCTNQLSNAHDWDTTPHSLWYQQNSSLSDCCYVTVGQRNGIQHIRPTKRLLPCSFLRAINTEFVNQYRIDPYVVYKFYQAKHLDQVTSEEVNTYLECMKPWALLQDYKKYSCKIYQQALRNVPGYYEHISHQHDQLVKTHAWLIAIKSLKDEKYAHADTIKVLYHNEQLRINTQKQTMRQQKEQAKIIYIDSIYQPHLKFFEETGLNSDAFYAFSGNDQQNALHTTMCDFLYDNHTHMTRGHDTITSSRDVAVTLVQHHFVAAYTLNTINQLSFAEQTFIIAKHLVLLAAGAVQGTIQGAIARGTELVTNPIGSASDFIQGLIMLPIAIGYYGGLVATKCAKITAPLSMMADDEMCAEFFEHYKELQDAIFDRLPSFTLQQLINWYDQGLFNHLNEALIYVRKNVATVAHPAGAILFDIIVTRGCHTYGKIPCTIISSRLKKSLATIKATMPTVPAMVSEIKDSGIRCKEFIGKKINALIAPNPIKYAEPAGLPNASCIAMEAEEIGSKIQRKVSNGTTIAPPEISTELAEVATKVTGSLDNTVPKILQPLGRGSTGRATPDNLHEQLVLKEIMSNPTWGKKIELKNGMTDPRWHQSEGWEKMYYEYTDCGKQIHYVAQWDNGIIKAVDDFKFKDSKGK